MGGLLGAFDRAYPSTQERADTRSAFKFPPQRGQSRRLHRLPRVEGPLSVADAVAASGLRRWMLSIRHYQETRRAWRSWGRSNVPGRGGDSWRAYCPDADGWGMCPAARLSRIGDPRLCVPASRQVCLYRRLWSTCSTTQNATGEKGKWVAGSVKAVPSAISRIGHETGRVQPPREKSKPFLLPHRISRHDLRVHKLRNHQFGE